MCLVKCPTLWLDPGVSIPYITPVYKTAMLVTVDSSQTATGFTVKGLSDLGSMTSQGHREIHNGFIRIWGLVFWPALETRKGNHL